MDPDQTAPFGAVWSEFVAFASIIKSNLKCTWIYAAECKRTKHIGGIRVDTRDHVVLGATLNSQSIILHVFSVH